MYGQSQYGTSQYGSENEQNELVSSSVDLLQYLPSYYQDIKSFNKLMNVEEEELSKLWFERSRLLDQFFVNKATIGIPLWESELGLAIDETMPLTWRRERINAKLRGVGTVTKQMIINTATAFSGGEVDVVEYPAENRFEIQFIGVKGIPPNIVGFIEMIEQIKPAHLTYSFKYTYTVWDTVKQLTWQQASNKTWGQLKVYEGV